MKVSVQLTNFFVSIALVVLGMRIENYRVWNPGKLTGWAFASYGILLALAITFGVLVVLAFKSKASPKAPWYVISAAIIAFVEGVFITLFFTAFDFNVEWQAVLRGLGFGAAIGALVALLTLTLWVHPKWTTTAPKKHRISFLP